MGRINTVLNEEVDYGFEGGPRYKTNVIDNPNGLTERESQWRFARHEYSASFENMNNASRDNLLALYHVLCGQAHSFLFKDWNDYLAENEALQVVPGTTATVQLYKTYWYGPAYTVRPVQALKTALVYDNNGNVVGGTFNDLTGEFTPTAAWGTGDYTWSGEFYVWVVLKDDYNPMQINSWEANSSSIDLVEDKFAFNATNVPMRWIG